MKHYCEASGTNSGELGPHMQNTTSVRLFTHPILTNSNDANARVGLHSDFGYKVSEQKKQMVTFMDSASVSFALGRQAKDDGTG